MPISTRLLVLILLGISTLSIAESSIGVPPPPATITVGITNSYPWGWHDSDGQAQGIHPDLARALIAKASPGTQLDFQFGSHDRIIRELLARNIDIVYSPYIPKLASHSRELHKVGAVNLELWSLPETPINSIEQIRNRHITLASRVYLELPFMEQTKTSFISASQRLIPVLLSKRTHGIVELQPALNAWASKSHLNRDDFTILTLSNVDAYIWVSHGSPITKQWQHWQQAAQAANSNSVLKKLILKYEKSREP